MTNSSNYISIRELINLAIQIEAGAADFYHKLADSADNEQIKDVLILLEKEELNHKKILLELEISDGSQILQFSPEFKFTMPEIEHKNLSLNELLDIAYSREEKAFKIYNNMAAMTSGKMKQILEGLAVFEKNHMEKVKNLKNFYLNGVEE